MTALGTEMMVRTNRFMMCQAKRHVFCLLPVDFFSNFVRQHAEITSREAIMMLTRGYKNSRTSEISCSPSPQYQVRYCNMQDETIINTTTKPSSKLKFLIMRLLLTLVYQIYQSRIVFFLIVKDDRPLKEFLLSIKIRQLYISK